MEELFKEKSQRIRIYIGTETETDPFKHIVSTIMLNPRPIDAIVTDLSFAKIQWTMPGIVTEQAKEIIIEKKHETLFKLSQKIKIGNDFYEGWRQNGRLQYKIEQNYIRAYIYIKKE